MAVLEESEVIQLAKEEVDEWILLAREDHIKLKMHYFGEGKDKFLQKVEGLETDAELELRKRFSMTNEFLTDILIRPMDNIWAAKGTTVTLDFTMDINRQLFELAIKNIRSGLNIKNYTKQIWKDKFITDPAGLFFVEVSQDGLTAIATQKAITTIRKMQMNGIQPEYVMFEADVIEIKKGKVEPDQKNENFKLHWFVDDAFYYRVKVWDDKERNPEIIETIVNQFEKVPGFANSPIWDTNRKFFISPIWKQIDLLDKYLVNGSVKEIFQAKHGYPIFAIYGNQNMIDICQTCEGVGQVHDTQTRTSGGRSCGSCGGSGFKYRKQVSDIHVLTPPKSKDDPVLPWFAQYVGPDLATWTEQRTEQDWTKDLLHFSLWGTTIEKGDNATATGRFIDVQPVNNRANDFSDIVEVVHTNIINLFAKLFAPESFRGADVNYSRKYLFETVNQVWKMYIGAKKDKASETLLGQLLAQWYETEYQSNDLLRAFYLKVLQIDPLPHVNLDELEGITAPENFKQRKIYLKSWLQTKMITEVIQMPIEKAIEDLDKFILDIIGVGLVPGLGGGVSGEDIPENIGAEAEAKARLKGSVGGVQGIIQIQQSVAAGTTQFSAAIAILNEIFGFDDATARQILGTPPSPNEK